MSVILTSDFDSKPYRESSVTAVGGTITIPEVAVSFSGGGFSDLVRLSIV